MMPWRERLASDPRRPQYHLLPAANWMNDPNGPIYWNGNYHMFYQYNPNAARLGVLHWAHAISRIWSIGVTPAIALAPTPGGPDAAGCFSGTAVVDGNRVRVLYTGWSRLLRTKPLATAFIPLGKRSAWPWVRAKI